jgi:hypothetical protein
VSCFSSSRPKHSLQSTIYFVGSSDVIFCLALFDLSGQCRVGLACVADIPCCGLARADLKLCFLEFVQVPSSLSLQQRISSNNPVGRRISSFKNRRHSLPKTTVDDLHIRRLQRLLDSPMMQQNDSGWTRQRQRSFIKSRIVALGGAL